ERGGLAGARLGLGQHVTAFEHQRDGLGLDRRRSHEAEVFDRSGDFGMDGQVAESSRFGRGEWFLWCQGQNFSNRVMKKGLDRRRSSPPRVPDVRVCTTQIVSVLALESDLCVM